MCLKETKIQVHCHISNRPEIVYVRNVDADEVCLAHFAGCDSSYHKCDDCDVYCYQKAKQQFTQAYDGSRQILWHTL